MVGRELSLILVLVVKHRHTIHYRFLAEISRCVCVFEFCHWLSRFSSHRAKVILTSEFFRSYFSHMGELGLQALSAGRP